MGTLVSGTINGIIVAGVLALPVLGIAVIYGMTGIINFAVGGIGVLGAFTTWYLLRGSPILAILAGIGISFAIGFVVQSLFLTPISERRGGDLNLFFLITNSLGLMSVSFVRILFPQPNIGLELPRLGTFSFLSVQTSGLKLFALAFAVCSLLLLRLFEKHTQVGRSWRATSQDLRLAKLMGVNTAMAFAVASGFGCALAALGAIIWGSLYSLNLNSGFDMTFLGYIIAVVGGIGNIVGGMIAALLMGLVMSFSVYVADGSWQSVILYGIAMLVLVVAPRGLLGSERSI